MVKENAEGVSNYERKVEPRLKTEISRREAARIPDPIDVQISFEGEFQLPQVGTREEKIRLSREWASEYQKDIIAEIGKMGVDDFKQELLFNYLNASLTPGQIRTLADNEKVDRFTWNKLDGPLTANPPESPKL